MRVSSSSLYVTLADGLGASLARVQQHQAELASGKRINRYSDDPSGSASALRLRSQEADWETYERSAHNGLSWTDAADTTLQTSSTLLTKVKELSVNAVNGAMSPSSREALASEVGQLKEHLVRLANTTHLGRSLFGGFGDEAVSSAGGTWSYAGDAGAVQRKIGPDATVQVNLSASAIYGFDGAPGSDMFSVLDRLQTAVASGDAAAISAEQATLDVRTEGLRRNLGQVGSISNRIESAIAQGAEARVSLRASRSQIEDTDFASAILKLGEASAGYQAALGAAARADLPSLADFLR